MAPKKLKAKTPPIPTIPADNAPGWRKEALRQRKEVLRYRRTLEEFTAFVGRAVKALDQIMEGPASNDRGRAVAKLNNTLELQTDIVRLESLGIVPPEPLAYRSDKKSGSL
jgi:hypothetical protein